VSDDSAAIGRGTRAAEAVLWFCASIVVLTTHVGGAAWLLREPPAMAAEDAPPAAIMVELAPESEAVFTETNEIAPDLETSAPNNTVEATPAPDEAPSEEGTDLIEPTPAQALEQNDPAEPEPVPMEPIDQEIESAEDEAVILPEGVEVPLPVFRPRPQERKVAEDKVEPRKREAKKPPRQQAASTSATRAQAHVSQSDRNAGRQTASGTSSLSPARWQSRLMAHLERRKRYPATARSRGEQGTVYVRFSIDGSGNVMSVVLARSSGFPDLDNEVLSLVRRVSPVPPPPGGAVTITAPVRFKVR
jgi:periplasmic protein TonB